ncbi:MAG: zinc-ribbon domain-containing protein [Deltaproteobacteria bacterium]|nr:zinc-ribbon domain-containing protein [Deltaproteobacteria bacterium]
MVIVNKCLNCGKDLPPEARFCMVCGAAVERAEGRCPHCGTEAMPGAVFCNQCGKKIN